MGFRVKDPAGLKRTIDARSAGREMGPLTHGVIAAQMKRNPTFVSAVIGGSRECSEQVARELLDALGHPWLRFRDVFGPSERMPAAVGPAPPKEG